MSALRLYSVLLCTYVGLAGGETLAELIATEPQLSRFWDMLNGTGVRDVLNGNEATFTVFAPTNEAVREFMVPGVVGILEKKPEYKKKLAAYHVTVAKRALEVKDVPATYAGMATTLWGNKVLLESSSDVVRVNGKAQIISADASPDVSNGAIHIVNGVLSYPGWFPEEDLVTLLHKDSKLRAFYVTMWDVRDEIGLTDKGPLTVFVPTNKAFARAGLGLKGTSLNTLLEEDREKVIRILRYHIVHSKYLTRSDLFEPGVAQTIDVHRGRANYLAFQKDGTGTVDMNNGEAKVVADKKSTVQATNGVLHVIDKLLLPPGVEVPDVNYSSMRSKSAREAMQVTPEPEVIVAAPTGTPQKKKNPVFLILVLAAVTLLAIHRLVAPPESHVDKRRRRPDIALAVALVLLAVVPLFSTMKWALPPGLRWASDEVRDVLFKPAAPKVVVQPEMTKTMHTQQLDYMLNYLDLQLYRSKLLDYGLDRIDLIAIATAEDGERAGVKLGHWTKLQEEARKRHPVTADVIDLTPEPPTEYVIGRHPPAKKLNPDEEKELNQAGELANMFDQDSKLNKEQLTLPPQMSPTLQPIVLNKAPPSEESLKKFVIAAITIPSTGVSTVECTFGTKHGNFAHRDAKQLDNIKYVRVQSLNEARGIRSSLGTRDFKDVSPRATVVTVLVATRPVSRFIRSFYKTVGKTITPESDFKCEEKMRLKMKEPKFGLEDYVRLPDKARRLCEGSCNPMVKALTDTPLGEVVGPGHLEQAARNLKEIDVLMIDDDNEKKSMLGLLSKVNLTEGSYIPCSSYHDTARTEYSLRASDVIARDNDMDRQLFSEIHHVFNTRYAGTLEMTVDAAKVECDPAPTVCFDENDRNGEKKAKDLYTNVNTTIRRSSSLQSVMCAGRCWLPKDVFHV